MNQLNAAFYCFAPLENVASLRAQWRPRLEAIGVKGTIILAPEGVNGFLAGTASALRDALSLIRSFPVLEGLDVKESVSTYVPFEKLCIKLKKEIVTFRVPGMSPVETAPAPRIQPEELDAWYAEGRDFVMLDTRNSYEFRLGTFTNAVDPGLHHFVDFAAAAKKLPEEWKHKPVVTFCTGGIRCEKAAPYLQSLGFENVRQLDGGILRYFEKTNAANFRGDCFVFDARVALDSKLQATGAALCAACQGPVPSAVAECIHCHATVVR
jgi:UPF0176 protein